MIRFLSPLWNNPVTRAIVGVVAAVGTILLFGMIREREGRLKAEARRAAEDAKRKAELKEKSHAAGKRADDADLNRGRWESGRVLDGPKDPRNPLADEDYRD
jgi:hypothetical protein